jgi:hypothetical protein
LFTNPTQYGIYSTCIFCFTFLVINLWFNLWNFPTWSRNIIQISQP